jgi:hypothetical protein
MNATHGDAAKPGRSAPVVFYRHGDLVVTDRTLRVGDREYPLAELSDLRAARGPRDQLTGALAAATGAVGVAVALAALHLDLARWVAALAVLLIVGCLLGYRLLRRPRVHELHAEYRGAMVVLLAEPQALRFGQICRALNRALEYREAAGG